MFLERQFIEKPWGRSNLPPEFGASIGQRIGEIWYTETGQKPLPLLVKWLFTSEKLSIQVHPSDADAHRRGLPSGKEECWYIVEAEPGAVLGIGTRRPLTPQELRAAALCGGIEQLMDWKPAKAGDFYYIPAGTVHAIGAGITLVEVQQPADITYRLYDYGRPRELHLEDGVAVAQPRPYSDVRSGNARDSRCLVSGPHFWLQHIASPVAIGAIAEPGPYWIVPIGGILSIGGTGLVRGACALVDSLDGIAADGAISLLVAGIATSR